MDLTIKSDSGRVIVYVSDNSVNDILFSIRTKDSYDISPADIWMRNLNLSKVEQIAKEIANTLDKLFLKINKINKG